jgi:hypothetical protein
MIAHFVKYQLAAAFSRLGVAATQQVEIYQQVRTLTGAELIVHAATEVLQNPRGMLDLLCRAVGVSPDERMPRYKLKGAPVKVIEIAPPWVQTDLLRSNNEPRAMPLADFVEETMLVLGTDAEEVLWSGRSRSGTTPAPGEDAFVNQFNDMMASPNRPVSRRRSTAARRFCHTAGRGL